MQEIQPIINHIVKVYNFEIVPVSIPKNNFQYLKRNFYIFILNKVSKKLFYFIRDKVSPIKFLKERPDNSIWLRKRLTDYSCEIEIIPVPPEACIYSTNVNNLFKPMNGDNYHLRIFYSVLNESNMIEFPINHINCDKIIDINFSQISELKEILRDYKLKNLLNE